MKGLKIFATILSLAVSIAADREFQNPIKNHAGADPWIWWYREFYWMMVSGTPIVMYTSNSVATLSTMAREIIWTDDEPSRKESMSSPKAWRERHDEQGTWYIYYSATGGADPADWEDNRRMHVLIGQSPLGKYTYGGQLGDFWGTDPYPVEIRGKTYLQYSCREHGMNGTQGICLSIMYSPVHIGPPSIISMPTEPWEKAGRPLNAAPAVFTRDSISRKIHMTYSAGDPCSGGQSTGLLTLEGDKDPMDKKSWTKTGPVFQSANGSYAPGHSFYFQFPKAPNNWWHVYHATKNPNGSCYDDRYTMIQPLKIFDDVPFFGGPLKYKHTMKAPCIEGETQDCQVLPDCSDHPEGECYVPDPS